MDFRFTQEQEKFRKEVRAFLEREIKEGVFQTRVDAWMLEENDEFTRHVATQGWLGMTWPKEYGGQGRTYLDRLVFTEEAMRYGAPMGGIVTGDRQIGPALINSGNEEQRKYFINRARF